MEEQYKSMLDLMRRPAFCVKDGCICHVNPAARAFLLCAGTPVDTLIASGQEEYNHFCGGSLYLTLSLGQNTLGAEVVQMGSQTVFLLEEPESAGELRSLALAAKELREPLAGILTITDRLMPQDPAREQTAQMNRRLFQLMRMVSNMSDAFRYSQPGAGRMEYVQITSLYDEIFARAGLLLEQAGIRLVYSGLQEPVFTLADPELLERAAYNLLSNAAKFTPKNGSIHVQLQHKGNRLYLSVLDEGPGISSQVKGSLYSRFQREPSLEDLRCGIGLGMVLVRSAAAAHGGAVLVDQKDGQGNRTTMTLQVQLPKQTSLRSPVMRIDYAGEWDHGLLELSDCLPTELYKDI